MTQTTEQYIQGIAKFKKWLDKQIEQSRPPSWCQETPYPFTALVEAKDKLENLLPTIDLSKLKGAVKWVKASERPPNGEGAVNLRFSVGFENALEWVPESGYYEKGIWYYWNDEIIPSAIIKVLQWLEEHPTEEAKEADKIEIPEGGLRVYEIAYSNGAEKDWVAARSALEAIQVICTVTSINIHELGYDDEVKEIPPSKWKGMKITDEYGVVELSFAQWMAINTKPDIIASTAH